MAQADLDDVYYSDEYTTSDEYTYSESSSSEEENTMKYYVSKESMENLAMTKKSSYVGLRDLSDVDKIQEKDIVASDGSIRGVRNRVRAGLANFENREALEKKKQEEGKIILYVTSFRGVRTTFEECRYVQRVLHNFLVKVDERDIYVNKSFYRELEDRLEEQSESSRVTVPQVFISGQHIGGKDEIEELTETGELRHLLENCTRSQVSKKCGYCGGYEFIPCRKCSGTKDSVKNTFTSEFKALRCTHCNENGLEPCPGCKEGSDGGDMWNEEGLKKWREREQHEKQEEEERRKKEKRERIKREALEAEFQKNLKREREQIEKLRMRDERKKKKAKDAAAISKVADDIKNEMEKEKQWREERKSFTDSS